jgi:DNA-binding response OmpR family regulator
MPDSLNGLRILVVEDMFLVAEDLSDTLQGWGCDVVGPAARVDDALRLVDVEQLDGAVLDVNLGDEFCFPVAQALREKGTPFLFLTGYDMASAFPPEFEAVPRLSKPVDTRLLAQLATEHFSRTEAGSS